jgi:mono/diheme cytochrome c family protein
MKAILSIVLMVALELFVLFNFQACDTPKKVPPKENTVEEKPAPKSSSLSQIISGERIVLSRTRCLDCHSQRNWEIFGGPIIKGTEGMGGMVFNKEFGAVPGVVYARNITPAGIGDWSDEELMRAITQGITKKGDTLYPIMPYVYYNKMAKDELADVVAYIRSLKSVENIVSERKLNISASSAYPISMINQNIDNNRKPSEFDKVKYGEYLVTTAGCANCHTPLNAKREYQFDKIFAGGFRFKHEKFTAISANITPDPETGIGNWSEELFLTKFKDYRDPSFYNFNPGRKNTFMPWLSFSQMDDYDLKSIYAYLRTIKPISNKVNKFPE